MRELEIGERVTIECREGNVDCEHCFMFGNINDQCNCPCYKEDRTDRKSVIYVEVPPPPDLTADLADANAKIGKLMDALERMTDIQRKIEAIEKATGIIFGQIKGFLTTPAPSSPRQRQRSDKNMYRYPRTKPAPRTPEHDISPHPPEYHRPTWEEMLEANAKIEKLRKCLLDTDLAVCADGYTLEGYTLRNIRAVLAETAPKE